MTKSKHNKRLMDRHLGFCRMGYRVYEDIREGQTEGAVKVTGILKLTIVNV